MYPNEKNTLDLLFWLIGLLYPKSSIDNCGFKSSKQDLSEGHIVFNKASTAKRDRAVCIQECIRTWREERCLYAWPNRVVSQLYGFEKLAFRTRAIDPVYRRKENAPEDKSSLFDHFSSSGSRIVSVLEEFMSKVALDDPLKDVLSDESTEYDEEDVKEPEKSQSTNSDMTSDVSHDRNVGHVREIDKLFDSCETKAATTWSCARQPKSLPDHPQELVILVFFAISHSLDCVYRS